MITYNDMQIAHNSVFSCDMKFEPQSYVLCEIKLHGSEHNIKLDITAYVYFKESVNRTGLKQSQTESIYTSREDRIYKIILKVPDFPVNDVTKSHVMVTLDNNNSSHSKINVEYINISSVTNGDILSNGESEKNKVIFVSTWDQKCGIALYTKDLLDSLESLNGYGLFLVRGIDYINNRKDKIFEAKLVHLQHEFGIMPKPPEAIENGVPVIVTWHTILPSDKMKKVLTMFETKLNVVAHIVPCEGALEYLKPGVVATKDVHVVSLGSRLMPNISKEDARKLLDMDIKFDRIINGSGRNKDIGFVFGFQSANKNYDRMINAAKNCGIHLIISGSIHQCGFDKGIKSDNDITIVNRYLSDAEIDLIALASDVLIFDYVSQEHYSASSALHRTVGAGRPVVCCNTKHFDDIREEIDGALKFNDIGELESCIRRALERKEELGNNALEFAKRTSRDEMAKRHMEIYRKYVSF